MSLANEHTKQITSLQRLVEAAHQAIVDLRLRVTKLETAAQGKPVEKDKPTR